MPSGSTFDLGKNAATLNNPTSATVFKAGAPNNTNKAVSVGINGDFGGSSVAFRVRARGRATTGTTSNFQAKIQFSTDITNNNAATAGNNTDVFTLTNRSLASITRYWEIDLRLYWDATSQRLTGQSNGFNNETIETANAAITALTGVDLTSATAGFVVAATFGTSNSGNNAFLDEFSMELL